MVDQRTVEELRTELEQANITLREVSWGHGNHHYIMIVLLALILWRVW